MGRAADSETTICSLPATPDGKQLAQFLWFKTGLQPTTQSNVVYSASDYFQRCRHLMLAAAGEHEQQERTLVEFRDSFAAYLHSWYGNSSGAAQKQQRFGSEEERKRLGTLLTASWVLGLPRCLDTMLHYVSIEGTQRAGAAFTMGSAADKPRGRSPLQAFGSKGDRAPTPRDLLVEVLSLYCPERMPAYSEATRTELARVLISWGWALPELAAAGEHPLPGGYELAVGRGQGTVEQLWQAASISVSPEVAYFARRRLDNQKRIGQLSKFLPADLKGLTRLPFQLIGQEETALHLLKAAGRHFMAKTARQAPLVLLFGGPSGHGKTELATKIAEVMRAVPLDGSNVVKISCGSMQTHTELFGLSGAYQNSDQHTTLNGELCCFIVSNCGRPAVVVLDEFEKLSSEAQEGFLEAWDTGRWIDKRTTSGRTHQTAEVDCSNVLFILTTNLALNAAQDPKSLKMQLPFPDEISGRIRDVFSFRTFRDSEKELLVAHYLDEACDQLQLGNAIQDEDVLSNVLRVLGRFRLAWRPADGAAAAILERCVPKHIDIHGVRTIKRQVDDDVRQALMELHLERQDELEQAGAGAAAAITTNASTVLALILLKVNRATGEVMARFVDGGDSDDEGTE